MALGWRGIIQRRRNPDRCRHRSARCLDAWPCGHRRCGPSRRNGVQTGLQGHDPGHYAGHYARSRNGVWSRRNVVCFRGRQNGNGCRGQPWLPPGLLLDGCCGRDGPDRPGAGFQGRIAEAGRSGPITPAHSHRCSSHAKHRGPSPEPHGNGPRQPPRPLPRHPRIHPPSRAVDANPSVPVEMHRLRPQQGLRIGGLEHKGMKTGGMRGVGTQ